jgi:hypothetical protein
MKIDSFFPRKRMREVEKDEGEKPDGGVTAVVKKAEGSEKKGKGLGGKGGGKKKLHVKGAGRGFVFPLFAALLLLL